jgi:antitoxin component of RelBE/YafQ-DinJ toxin-antitoxin module
MNIPVYNKEEPSYAYFSKLRDFEYFLKKEKYNIVFNFVTEITNILNIKIKSLIDFKRIPVKNLIKNEKITNLINSKHKEIITSLSLIEDETENTNIYDFLNKILYPIGYKLIKKTFDEQKYYCIVELK